MADAVRERREARRRKILESGSQRLKFIAESSASLPSGVAERAVGATTIPSQEAASEGPSTTPSSTPGGESQVPPDASGQPRAAETRSEQNVTHPPSLPASTTPVVGLAGSSLTIKHANKEALRDKRGSRKDETRSTSGELRGDVGATDPTRISTTSTAPLVENSRQETWPSEQSPFADSSYVAFADTRQRQQQIRDTALPPRDMLPDFLAQLQHMSNSYGTMPNPFISPSMIPSTPPYFPLPQAAHTPPSTPSFVSSLSSLTLSVVPPLFHASNRTALLRAFLSIALAMLFTLAHLYSCCFTQSTSQPRHTTTPAPKCHPFLLALSPFSSLPTSPSWVSPGSNASNLSSALHSLSFLASQLPSSPLLLLLVSLLSLILALALLSDALQGETGRRKAATAAAASQPPTTTTATTTTGVSSSTSPAPAPAPDPSAVGGSEEVVMSQLMAMAEQIRDMASRAGMLRAIAVDILFDVALFYVVLGCMLALASGDWSRPEAVCLT